MRWRLEEIARAEERKRKKVWDMEKSKQRGNSGGGMRKRKP